MRSGLLSQLVDFACRTQSTHWMLAVAVAGTAVAPACGQDLGTYRSVEKETGSAQKASDSEEEQTYSLKPYQRETTRVPVKNYYDELFGGEEKAASKQPTRVQTATLLRPVETEKKNADNGQEATPRDETASGTTILSAKYEYASDEEQTSQVMPVSAQEKAFDEQDLPAWAQQARSHRQKETEAAPDQKFKPETDDQQEPANPRPDLPHAVLRIDKPVPEGMTIQPAPSPKPTPEKQAEPSPIPTNAETTVARERIQQGPQNPNVKVLWRSRDGINVGQESTCELVVSNLGKHPAHGVAVNASFPDNVQLIRTTPELDESDEKLSWTLGHLPAGAERVIQVVLIPRERGDLNATAEVQFRTATRSEFVVREALVGLDVSGPSQVMVGQPAAQNVTITNPGNGVARNVQLEAVLPEGLKHTRGERLVMNVGSLNPGESRTIQLALAAVSGGEHTLRVTVSADGGLLEKSESKVTVIQPRLLSEIDGPGLRYKGRSATFVLRVHNDGTASTSNVRMMHKIPEGFEFVRSNHGATYDKPTRILSWFVGKLDAGKAAEMEVELMAKQIGEFTHYVRASSEHGAHADSQTVTKVEGASSLEMEIVDLDDPIEVGREAAYEIRITNEGTADANQVEMSCQLPEGVELIEAEGPTEFVTEQDRIHFRMVEAIPAGQTVKYHLKVVGKKGGNLRLRAQLRSAESPEPLTFEEMTRFYGDIR